MDHQDRHQVTMVTGETFPAVGVAIARNSKDAAEEFVLNRHA
jgi:hypothetical protein